MSQRPRVLIVDDSATARDIYGTYLRHGGYEVLEAPDGPAGLELLRTDRPDLVVLDVVLPGVDGLEVLRRIREDATVAHTPVVCVTAARSSSFRDEAAALGCAAFLEKPDTARQIVGLVNEILGDRRAAAGGAGVE